MQKKKPKKTPTKQQHSNIYSGLNYIILNAGSAVFAAYDIKLHCMTRRT